MNNKFKAIPVKYLPPWNHRYPHERSYDWHYDLIDSNLFSEYHWDRVPFNYYQNPIQNFDTKGFQFKKNRVKSTSINGVIIIILVLLYMFKFSK